MALNKVVLITGASSGIGVGIARELSAAGTKLMLGARRTDRLEALAEELTAKGGEVRTRRLDVTDRADVAAFAEAAREAFGRVDVIVNNAGVMPLSPMASLKVEEWDRMIDVNIKGVLYGIAAVLPEMLARGSGQIVNIASIGALAVSPTAAVYCATKYAVRAISDGLRQEQSDLRVTCIHPGWALRSGWPAVRDSWVLIFNNTFSMKFELTEVQVQVAGDIGWVICTENLASRQGEQPIETRVLATNLFERIGDEWLMIHHHGSPVMG